MALDRDDMTHNTILIKLEDGHSVYHGDMEPITPNN